jgi:TRAP-type mannitol/chloroaromatic compound transport system permease large subunit
VPVGFALFGSSVVYLGVNGIPLQMAAQRLAIGVDSFPLLAVPFFIMAGSAMNSVGITKRLFDFADHLVDHFTGGMGHANILASVIFSGMSGAAIADAGGLGQIGAGITAVPMECFVKALEAFAAEHAASTAMA